MCVCMCTVYTEKKEVKNNKKIYVRLSLSVNNVYALAFPVLLSSLLSYSSLCNHVVMNRWVENEDQTRSRTYTILGT